MSRANINHVGYPSRSQKQTRGQIGARPNKNAEQSNFFSFRLKVTLNVGRHAAVSVSSTAIAVNNCSMYFISLEMGALNRQEFTYLLA